MKERPILFSGEMVRAILDGRKTQTRRVIKPQPIAIKHNDGNQIETADGFVYKCPYGRPGDELWVRETFALSTSVMYKADSECLKIAGIKWKPSIHMRREYSRIRLKIKAIRVERVNEISWQDACHEGYAKTAESQYATTYWAWFMSKWNLINTKRGFGWYVNPWVWVIEFERIK